MPGKNKPPEKIKYGKQVNKIVRTVKKPLPTNKRGERKGK